MRRVLCLSIMTVTTLAGCNSEPNTYLQEDDIIAELLASGIEIEENDLRWTTPLASEFEFIESDKVAISPDIISSDSEPFLNPDVDEEKDEDPSKEGEGSQIRRDSQPIIETRRDLLAHLVGSDGISQLRETRLFQHVDEFPDHERFSGPEFDSVRRAINGKCASATRRFKGFVLSELSAGLSEQAGWDQPIDTLQQATIAREFGEHCLTKLDDLPEDVRSATGVLILGDRVFCSATATSETTILTSRHCFFHKTSGAPRSKQFNGLQRGQVAYLPNDGATPRTVRSGSTNTLANVAYGPSEDMIVLKLRGKVSSFAPVSTNASHIVSGTPVEAWLVGNHPTVLSTNSSVLGRVRGSAPFACSILQVTDRNCIYHVCQSSKSTSGGGLLVQTGNSLELVGVHRGTMAASDGCESNPDDLDELKKYQINIAAYSR